MKKPLIILTGPTAVGKTALSIGLAKAVGGQIISADSMQVYKGMDIGTAKIKPEQMQGVKHYLIDELEPQEAFNVMLFQKKCKQYMQQIYAEGKIPILVGGTGFYIQSVLYDIDFTENETKDPYRETLQEMAQKEGAAALHEKLRAVDPVSADTIHPNNVKRVIRALEYYHQTGQPISQHNETQKQKTSPYQFRYYVLSLDRSILYQRIEQRVDQMRREGLEEEVRRLAARGFDRSYVSMQGLGYKEILAAMAGECTMDEAFDRIKQETRHFAKRQFTWFRREKDVTWIDKGAFADEQELLNWCLQDLKQQEICTGRSDG